MFVVYPLIVHQMLIISYLYTKYLYFIRYYPTPITFLISHLVLRTILAVLLSPRCGTHSVSA